MSRLARGAREEATEPPRALRLLTRAGCHLCEVMEHEVADVAERFSLSLEPVDVDSDPVLERRYGRSVPVLLLGSREIARHRITAETLELRLLELGYRSSPES